MKWGIFGRKGLFVCLVWGLSSNGSEIREERTKEGFFR